MLRSYHANDRQVDSGVGVSYIKGKETKILILENGVFCRSIYLNSWKSRITHEQFLGTCIREDSMYQISEGFSDKEVCEFNVIIQF